MRYLRKAICVGVFTLLPGSIFAAKPVSVKHIEDIITSDETIYNYYVVRCNNGAEIDVSAWDGKKLWCLGKGDKVDCKKKQIKIAKLACKGAKVAKAF